MAAVDVHAGLAAHRRAVGPAGRRAARRALVARLAATPRLAVPAAALAAALPLAAAAMAAAFAVMTAGPPFS